jgi:indole-3-glycerol phosphate synthase
VILDEIVAEKRRAHEKREPVSIDELRARCGELGPARPFAGALRDPARPAPRAIAEFKRKSPSAGAIRAGADASQIAQSYARAGAAAISVLTDEKFFDGGLDDLQAARAAGRPIVRKDFLLDARDLCEARLAGADAILLIVRILDDDKLRMLIAEARDLGLAALVEAHTDREIERALAAGARIIGVNHRDLDTLAIDLTLSARARKLVGPDVVLVAESGISTRAHVAQMREHGADAILVGEALMRAPDPGKALEELLCS